MNRTMQRRRQNTTYPSASFRILNLDQSFPTWGARPFKEACKHYRRGAQRSLQSKIVFIKLFHSNNVGKKLKINNDRLSDRCCLSNIEPNIKPFSKEKRCQPSR